MKARVLTGGAVVAVLMILAVVLAWASGRLGDTGAGGTTTAPSSTTAAPGAPPLPLRPTRSRGCDGQKPPVTVGAVSAAKISSSGIDRTYNQWIPTSYDTNTPIPLVVDLHGLGEGLDLHMQTSDLNGSAERHGFINITPLGSGTSEFWNAVPVDKAPDDVRFIADLIDRLGSRFCIDLTRVYVVGLSNGALMTSLIGCDLADRVAAIAPVAGFQMPASCAPARAMPVIAFHGTADQFVLFDNPDGLAGPAARAKLDEVDGNALSSYRFQSVLAALEQWAKVDGCTSDQRDELISPSVRRLSYDGCRDGAVVQLYVAEGGGHTWPGSETSAKLAGGFGPTTFEIDANELIWAFFEAHRLPG